MLQRIRTLAVQAANGTNTAKDRKALQEEVKALSHEITRIAKKTTFAGAQVLDGGGTNTLMRPINKNGAVVGHEYFFQVGANAKDEITLESGAFTMKGIMDMYNAPLQQAQKLGIENTEAGAGKSGLAKSAANAADSAAYWVVSDPAAAQNTLANIDKFIEVVDSKRAALGAIQNHSCDILAA